METYIKQITVNALQLKWDTWNEMCDFAEVPTKAVGVYVDKNGNALNGHKADALIGLSIYKGKTIAKEGDWIIKDKKGDLHVCASDIFEKTYIQYVT